MYVPSFEEVLHHSSTYTIIPVRYSFLADQATPIHLYEAVRQPDSFLLESVEGGTRWARYSFIGLNPFLKCRVRDGALHVHERGKASRVYSGNPVSELRALLDRLRSPRLADMPPFTGGAVGFLGYDTLQFVETLPQVPHDELKLDTMNLLFTDEVIAYDHVRQEVSVIVNLIVPEGADEAEIRAAYADVCSRIARIVQHLTSSSARIFHLGPIPQEGADLSITSNMTKEQFMDRVQRAQEYIAAGDIFQVVLSQRFAAPAQSDPLLIYRVLRLTNPSPYMYYFETEGTAVVGTSPELLVKVTGDKVETRPIAGTRPRGRNEEEDAALTADMLSDQKELAEHLMLLDLGRNDVGRVSRYGSVYVTQQMEVEYYSRVMHIVSHVCGELAADKEPFDALLSCFPAGTVSGSPKLRAMEIIAELEGEARGFYAGAVGYFSFCGNLDSCITIRTIVCKDGMAYVQAGAGIVADSVPEMEYEETRNKAQAMFHALALAEKMTSSEEMRSHV